MADMHAIPPSATTWCCFFLSRYEHSKRFPDCGYLKAKKDFTELTVAELYNLEKERLKIFYVRTKCTKLFVPSHL